MSEPIKPALTPEEWADPEHNVRRDGFWLYEPGQMCLVVGADKKGVSIEELRHAVAALTLYGQPFGFTREHVTILRTCALEFSEYGLHDIADRIAALLPPEK